jgi:hypothetical protein
MSNLVIWCTDVPIEIREDMISWYRRGSIDLPSYTVRSIVEGRPLPSLEDTWKILRMLEVTEDGLNHWIPTLPADYATRLSPILLSWLWSLHCESLPVWVTDFECKNISHYVHSNYLLFIHLTRKNISKIVDIKSYYKSLDRKDTYVRCFIRDSKITHEVVPPEESDIVYSSHLDAIYKEMEDYGCLFTKPLLTPTSLSRHLFLWRIDNGITHPWLTIICARLLDYSHLSEYGVGLGNNPSYIRQSMLSLLNKKWIGCDNYAFLQSYYTTHPGAIITQIILMNNEISSCSCNIQ